MDTTSGTGTSTSTSDPVRSSSAATPAQDKEDAALLGLMELLFFAYRDFIAEPDAMLAELGFGRAHHRVLHFVGRHPGLRVSELLAILRITKQSLGRVLRELVERGYVVQEESAVDRRQRLLHLTGKGRRLLQRLEEPQIERVRAALQAAGPRSRAVFARTLLMLVDKNERPAVARLCGLPELLSELLLEPAEEADDGTDAASCADRR